jgi:hypothetical protein
MWGLEAGLVVLEMRKTLVAEINVAYNKKIVCTVYVLSYKDVHEVWYGSLGISLMNSVQMGYTYLCVCGCPVGIPMVIVRNIHRITTSGC